MMAEQGGFLETLKIRAREAFLPSLSEERIEIRSKREYKQLEPVALAIKRKSSAFKEEGISDEELRRRACSAETPAELFSFICFAFERKINLSPFVCQIVGGLLLCEQKRGLEMKTGEGKTLVIPFPVIYRALRGIKAHVATANDYLARRDAAWMRPLYQAFGVSVGLIQADGKSYLVGDNGVLDPVSRKEVYEQDVVYASGIEFGFDWLNDKREPPENRVQPPLADLYAIIDEADEPLIDQATTPLVISQKKEKETIEFSIFTEDTEDGGIEEKRIEITNEEFKRGANWLLEMIEYLKEENSDIFFEADSSGLKITETGWKALRCLAGETVEGMRRDLPSDHLPPAWLEGEKINSYPFLVRAALQVVWEIEKDVHYVSGKRRMISVDVVKNEIHLFESDDATLVDQNTGHPLPGQNYEGWLGPFLQVAVARKNGKLANLKIRFPVAVDRVGIGSYFNQYGDISVLSGSLIQAVEELWRIYGLEITVLPTNKPVKRQDKEDQIFPTEKGKIEFLIKTVAGEHDKGRPVLIGTSSVEESEKIAEILKKENLPCQVLSAKNPFDEAEVIKTAGQQGSITVGTQMAGRGVDIVLGGDPDGRNKTEWQEEHDAVVELGGLLAILVQHYPNQRMDEQFRGRSGRQGDPGKSVVLVSPEDKIFSGRRLPAHWREKLLAVDWKERPDLIRSEIKEVQKFISGRERTARMITALFDRSLQIERENWEKEWKERGQGVAWQDWWQDWPDFIGELKEEWQAVLAVTPLESLETDWVRRSYDVSRRYLKEKKAGEAASEKPIGKKELRKEKRRKKRLRRKRKARKRRR